jgi:cytochrome d ubiquinol oxidase subunit I
MSRGGWRYESPLDRLLSLVGHPSFPAATMSALAWHRYQFAFTIVFHYLFPQLTMGLALIIVIFKALALRKNDARYADLARFWARAFAINFTMGVVTGIPLEFQFGTNWARFSAAAGGVIGNTLAMEGLFAFFAESTFLGLFLFGEKKLSPRAHLLTAFMVFLGSWVSGYFIVTTNAFMQHPVGHAMREVGGRMELVDMWGYLFNPWAIWQYGHVMCGAVLTGTFVVASVAAYWMLMRRHEDHARAALKTGVVIGLVAALLQLFPFGDREGKFVAAYQRPTLAAMEGKFKSSDRADLVLIGQPDVEKHRLENPIVVPWALSFLSYGTFGATVTGLDDLPREEWPDNVDLLYYVYHVMVGIGTLLILVMVISVALLRHERLFKSRFLLWVLMLCFPFPYIANTAGWMTAELGRQPWVVYGILRTAHGSSENVNAGNVVFSVLGFMGLYLVLGVLFLFLVARLVARGPALIAPAGPVATEEA